MELAALPGDTPENSDPRSLQSAVVIAGDQPDATQATRHQAVQESAPVDFMLAQ